MATLEVSMTLTMNDGTQHKVNSVNDFGQDDVAEDDATEQYWAMLKGTALASEDEERKTREERKAKRNSKTKAKE